MNQLTIRGFDPELESKVRELARREGVSLNQMVLRLLRRAARVESGREHATIGDSLDDLAGTWTADEEHAFLSALRPFEKIDLEMWHGAAHKS